MKKAMSVGSVGTKKAKLVAPKSMFASEKIKRFELSDGQWLDIRQGVKATEVMSDPNEVQQDAVQSSFKLLSRVIADWNLVDENGQQVPYSPEALQNLNMPAMMFLMQECNKAIGLGETEEEEKKE